MNNMQIIYYRNTSNCKIKWEIRMKYFLKKWRKKMNKFKIFNFEYQKFNKSKLKLIKISKKK